VFKRISYPLKKLWFFPVTLLLMTLAGTNQAADVQTVLKKADSYRVYQDQLLVETHVTLYKSGTLDKERHYSVYLKPGRRSLVIFKAVVERGQKMLMLEEKYWMIMPNSKRPIRVTAQQKLLGEAATGDIASLVWSGDYDGEIKGKVRINNVPCLKLDIKSIREGTTYARIVLHVAEDDYHPVQADFYVASGRIAKHVDFAMGEVSGKRLVQSMTMIDKIQTNRKTVITYQSQCDQSRHLAQPVCYYHY
jgi:hypothetical protein